MTSSGRRPKDRDFVVRIAFPECFRSRFVYCFRFNSHPFSSSPKVERCGCNIYCDSPD